MHLARTTHTKGHHFKFHIWYAKQLAKPYEHFVRIRRANVDTVIADGANSSNSTRTKIQTLRCHSAHIRSAINAIYIRNQYNDSGVETADSDLRLLSHLRL